MKETVITVTEAARNFADCVNRAHYQNRTFVLLKNGKPFARIEPDKDSHYGDGAPGRARHSVRAVRSQAPRDRRARSDAPYQPDKMRIAGIEPDKEKRCTGRDLAQALAKAELSAEEARAWRRDLGTARKSLAAPADKWR